MEKNKGKKLIKFLEDFQENDAKDENDLQINFNREQFREMTQMNNQNFITFLRGSSSKAPDTPKPPSSASVLLPKVPKFLEEGAPTMPYYLMPFLQQKIPVDWQKMLIPVNLDEQQQQPTNTVEAGKSTASTFSTVAAIASPTKNESRKKRPLIASSDKNTSKRKNTEKGESSKQKKNQSKKEKQAVENKGDQSGTELLIVAENALKTLDNSILERKVFQMLELSLSALDYDSFDLELMKIIFQNSKEINTAKLEKLLEQMDVNKVSKQLNGRLFGDKITKESPIFSYLLGQIETQMTNVWGLDPFRKTDNNDLKMFGITPEHFNAKKRGALLFFYSRLFTKLSSLLEAPFNDHNTLVQISNKQEITHREAQMIWMNVSRQIILKELSTKYVYQFPVLAKLDEFEIIADRLTMALLAIEFTIGPMTKEIVPKSTWNNDAFLHLLDYIKQKNIACFLVARKHNDLKQIPLSIETDQANQGFAITFLRLFIETIKQEQSGQNVDNVRRIADFYRSFYTKLINFIMVDESEKMIKAYKNLIKFQSPHSLQLINHIKFVKSAFKLVSDFLRESVIQLEQFSANWNTLSKVFGGITEVIRNNFLSIYCPQFTWI
ncbi:hypothetical protein niasHT_013969 [Heterodera trifolii]|uniref:Uncharacterized protein n=1 Tax=Heterodera trifolii TaxID=157864 RepID=A0ABD2KL70_9BILA